METPAIRARVVAHLRNVDEGLAKAVAEGLGLEEMPAPAPPARPVVTSLKPSPALSIVENGPGSFKGRKLGVLVTDGADMELLRALQKAVEMEGALMELVAPRRGGVVCSEGMRMEAGQQLQGGPSVLYDAVALLPSVEGAQRLATDPAARDFVNDAFAHCKFIAYGRAGTALLEACNLVPLLDEGVLPLAKPEDAAQFIKTCGALRFWPREEKRG